MKVHRLWNGNAPGSLGNDPADIPTLTEVSDERSVNPRPAFVVCPGGGYGGLADYEGGPIAEFLETLGIKGFVLKYRLGPKYHHPAMLDDVNRSIRLVRARSAEFGVEPQRVGVLGFSAGGHLASTAVTYFDSGNATHSDPIERVSSRPDLGMLFYPVITMGPLGHGGSRENLLGKDPPEKLVHALSSERNVSLQTPPCFLFHGADDGIVPIQNSLMFATALAEHRIPFEIHVPEHGQHGFALGEPGSPQDWRQIGQRWLKLHGFAR